MKKSVLAIVLLILAVISSCRNEEKRRTISLNGLWDIGEGSMDSIPVNLSRKVTVPGLVSMAQPSFINPGPKVKERGNINQKDSLREAFWYRRKFTIDGPVSEVAFLKVSKAMFGTKVIVNGINLGEHLPCFTPGWFNIKQALRRGENELLIRVGSCRGSLPRSVPDGFDFEKERYIPGIFDDVQLILCNNPAIKNVQAAPDISGETVHIRVWLTVGDNTNGSKLKFVVREANSGKVAGELIRDFKLPRDSGEVIVNVTVPVKGCRLWSPEDPFLYKLTVSSEGDEYKTRFGMRAFRLDTLTGRILLNNKPYFMRGSNITLYRFFEDDSCRDLPWHEDWIRSLHKSFKQFHWNGVRYCIGIAPEKWYDIADEEGIMIQNEFPVWYGGKGWCSWPAELKTAELAKEYREWIEEQWNHPSIVIWDASNETVSNDGKTEEVAEAVKQTRQLDMSGRPWDNSYSGVRKTGDVMELHPYHFQDPKFRLEDIANASPNPGGEEGEKRFMKIVNEYGWLWLNRDGTPTTLTRDLYRNLLGADSSVSRRREVYARYLASETEFWRCHRECAAVLHFTALGYSRGDGQTSDHFSDVSNLVYEKEFMKYIPDAFSPVGLMLDEWGGDMVPGTVHDFHVLGINDLEPEWRGSLALRFFDSAGNKISEAIVDASLAGFGKSSWLIRMETPGKPGRYLAVASLEAPGKDPVRSFREIPVVRYKKQALK